MYARHIQSLGSGKRRQYGWNASGKHCLAGSRRTYHEQVMSAGNGNFNGTPGDVLPFDIREIVASIGLGSNKCRKVRTDWFNL